MLAAAALLAFSVLATGSKAAARRSLGGCVAIASVEFSAPGARDAAAASCERLALGPVVGNGVVSDDRFVLFACSASPRAGTDDAPAMLSRLLSALLKGDAWSVSVPLSSLRGVMTEMVGDLRKVKDGDPPASGAEMSSTCRAHSPICILEERVFGHDNVPYTL
jgi:hypothetical protein